MGFEGLPRFPLVIFGYMDMHSSTFTQDGFWRPAPVPFGHIGTYGSCTRVPSPRMGFEGPPGPFWTYWDIWICTWVPSPRMGFEDLPWSPLVIMGHMDLQSSTFTQDGFWGTAPVPFSHNRTYWPALEYLHPGWVLRTCHGPLWS